MTTTFTAGPSGTDRGQRVPYFFNGRLLSAEDLTEERAGQLEAHRRLGQGIGAGVVWGLEVRENAATSSASKPVVTISAGLGISRDGQAIRLVADTDFPLPLTKEEAAAVSGDLFHPCCQTEPPPGTFVTGEGVYVLLMYPTVTREGSAPVAGLGNVDAPCNSKHLVEGAWFCLRKLPLTAQELADTRHLRNHAAYLCFGVEDQRLTDFLDNPFGPPVEDYGALDFLGSCHVPLALISINPAGASPPASAIQFIDLWSARRRPVHRSHSAQWNPFAGDRRLAEAEAAFYQFQDQADALVLTGENLSGIPATRDFLFLPAAGLLPVGGSRFDVDAFFKDWTTVTQVAGDIAFLRDLLHESLFIEPIKIAEPPPVLVYQFAERPGYVLFLRGEKASPAPPPPADQPSTPTGKGQFIILVADAEGNPVSPKAIEKVWVQSKDGAIYRDAARVDLNSDRNTRRLLQQILKKTAGTEFAFLESKTPGLSSGPFVKPGAEFLRYAIYLADGLPSGRYLVKATAHGHRVGFRDVALSHDGERKPIALLLTRQGPDLPKAPETDGVVVVEPPFLDRAGNRWDKFFILDKLFSQPIDFGGGFTDPSPELKATLDGVLQNMLDADPEGLFTPRTAGLLIRPDYTVNGSFNEPYAFVATADGARFPLLLVAQDHALQGSVSPAAAELPDLGAAVTLERLAERGLNQLDLVASAYNELLSETLGVSLEVARSFVADAKTGVATARRNFAHYPGMTPGLAASLRDAGFDDLRLANATLPELVQINAGFSGTFGERLIGQARGFLPQVAWSVATSELGFSSGELVALRARGIDSQGDFLRAADLTSPLRAGLLSAGFTDTRILAATTTITDLRSTTRARTAPRASLTAMPNVSPALAEKLVAAGIGSTPALANADPAGLVSLLNVSTAAADQMVRDATRLSVMTSLSLTANETTAVVGGAANLNSVATDTNAIMTNIGSNSVHRPELIGNVVSTLHLGRF